MAPPLSSAALNLLESSVIGQVHLRHQEFLKFLARLEGEFAKDRSCT